MRVRRSRRICGCPWCKCTPRKWRPSPHLPNGRPSLAKTHLISGADAPFHRVNGLLVTSAPAQVSNKCNGVPQARSLMLIGKPPDIPSSEITSREAYFRYLSRRRFLKGAAASGRRGHRRRSHRAARLAAHRRPRRNQVADGPQPAHHHRRAAHQSRRHHALQQLLRVRRRQGRPRAKCRRSAHAPLDRQSRRQSRQAAHSFDIDDLLKLHPLEDRVYRHRCVEAWSMVIPWVGYSLSEFIKQCDPLPQRQIRPVPLLLQLAVSSSGPRGNQHLLALLRRPAHG